ncbi:UDP-glucose 4-epimerase GalE [Neobacillus sedimentimangrovi]|jgi:UDP-glucose 4-epimerase|uniref:UDP-glucose 4-epimerase GalE n=1 Tax=Neobacillus sedimentimangrovi TaxID=2699460 RepID=UPI0013D41239|nr:UDP-glucose 4-epimerase GalE [Neobacillus sedimentimangrovi]
MILVVGGAGYIGSHTVRELLDQDYRVVVLDNLSTGHRESVDNRAQFEQGDLGNPVVLDKIFSKYEIKAVMHFAANSLVGESVIDPMKYYENNVGATLILLKKMIEHKVNKFIFSSTAATYGIPDCDMITENTPTNPINPYGRSKLMIEQILKDIHDAYGLSYITLRYFNAAGAHQSGSIGEDHSPETHLIPIILQHLVGLRDQITVFGSDYDTFDGTCIRDYIHVTDLANAHILSLQSLLDGTLTAETFNLGNGKGFSVKEVIKMCEEVTGKEANVVMADRRAGDPPQLVASSQKIYNALGWKAKFSLREIIESAWKWHQSHPNGYQDK